MTRLATPILVACALGIVAPGSAVAQGFAVNEHGTCVIGRAGTGVAAPCSDGSTINFNPAGIAEMDGITLAI